jgi:uncharacterized membrane protein
MRKAHTLPAITLLIALLASAPAAIAQVSHISISIISTFDFPSSSYIIVGTGQINDTGKYVGGVQDTAGSVFGFTANVSGNFSQPFAFPGGFGSFTDANGIRRGGEVCGTYVAAEGSRGFFRRGSSFQSYSAPFVGGVPTAVNSINDAGDFVGDYYVSPSLFAFAVIDEAFITIPLPGISPEATGINNLGQVVGNYFDDSLTSQHGFVRAADGTVTAPADFRGANTTMLRAINDAGYIVGLWTDNRKAQHAFVMKLPDTFISYDMPSANITDFTGINNVGQICGFWQDPHNQRHVLIAQLQTQ